jgi:hypothetical protein
VSLGKGPRLETNKASNDLSLLKAKVLKRHCKKFISLKGLSMDLESHDII